MTTRSIEVRTLTAATNIRASFSGDDLASMKASILQNGVLQNLIAAPRAANDPTLAVIAGITRFTALEELIAEGKLPADTRVQVLVRDDIVAGDVDSLAIALSENMIRTKMDFVDECAAMLMLAKGGKSESDIANLFGYRDRTVRERLLIAQVRPDALALVSAKTRSLDWARALTLADDAFQAQVVQDIVSNPNAWRTPEDIRAHLTRATIPAAYALFDAQDYTGPVVSDFFEGDKYVDIKAFWSLQNTAIDGIVADLEGEGYVVQTLRNEPFPEWEYTDAPQGEKGMAIVEVLSTGAVRIIRGKVAIKADDTATEDLRVLQDTQTEQDGIAPWEVRPTGRVLEYAAAHKSAMLQDTIAQDFETALRYSVASLMGAYGSPFAVAPFALPGSAKNRQGGVFQATDRLALAENNHRNDVAVQGHAMLASMDRTQLEKLFALLVARRAGTNRTAPDGVQDSAANIVGKNIDVRAHWTPDDAFFNILPTEDLRRLTNTLVPNATIAQTASMARKNLVKSLADTFAKAKAQEFAPWKNDQINTWTPGIMSFPAIVATNTIEENTPADVADALFGGL